MTRIRLRTENLTIKECRELLTVLKSSSDVTDAALRPVCGVMMTRGIQASLTSVEIVITCMSAIAGTTIAKTVAKPFEDIGKGFSEEMNCTEWGRSVARFLKSIPQRPGPYVPTISVEAVDSDEQNI